MAGPTTTRSPSVSTPTAWADPRGHSGPSRRRGGPDPRRLGGQGGGPGQSAGSKLIGQEAPSASTSGPRVRRSLTRRRSRMPRTPRRVRRTSTPSQRIAGRRRSSPSAPSSASGRSSGASPAATPSPRPSAPRARGSPTPSFRGCSQGDRRADRGEHRRADAAELKHLAKKSRSGRRPTIIQTPRPWSARRRA